MNESSEYTIRRLSPADQAFLWEMLYHALYVAEGSAPFARAALHQPELARYVKDWGREHDAGFVAVAANDRPVGAVWLRLLTGAERGFGYIDEQTPELGMAVLPAYRGAGIGTRLLARLIEVAGALYENISLSVAVGNPAVRLYQRLGFEVVGVQGNSLTMNRKLPGHDKAQR